MHFAMITMGAPGHVIASLPMITELVKKGNRVTYFSIPAFKAMVENTGAKYVEVKTALTEDGKADKDIAVDMLAELPLRFLSEGATTIEMIVPVLEQDMPDAIITDEMAIAGRLAGWHFNLPIIMLFTSYASNEHFSICRQWPEYPDDNPARMKAKALAEELNKKYGGRMLDLFEIFEGKGDFNIVTQPKEFHPAGETFGDDFCFAGAQITRRVDAGTWVEPAGDAPLLYTSLGTLFNMWPEFYHVLFDVVKDLDVKVVSSIGSNLTKEDLGEIPANVTTYPFLPQLDVLEKASYFITHAGTGSVMEAIHYGVPMLAIPQMDEQVLTASQMVKCGLGRMILKQDLTSETLKEALTDLVTNPVYRENMKKMQKAMEACGGAERAADEVIKYVTSLK